MEESNGAHDFKVIKKRLIAASKVGVDYISNLKIKEIAGVLDMQSTNFGMQHKIATNEWQYAQDMYPVEEFTQDKALSYIADWQSATSSVTAKGRLIWLYANKNTDADVLLKAQQISGKFEGKPIVVMLINDDDNRLYNSLVEYYVFDTMEDWIRKKYERHYLDGFKQAESNLKDEFEDLKKRRLRVLPDGINPIGTRMVNFLTGVFDQIYPDALPFWFDGFVTKANNLSGKGGTFYCSIVKMLLSGTVNSDSIHNFASDIKNRIDAVLMTTSNTSWKCINEQYRMIPPENKYAKRVYDEIVKELNDKERKPCAEIFEKYSKPPYGMSEDIITLMIAVVCANLSYCLRFEYNKTVTNINNWKDLVVIKDKKIDTSVIKQSVFIVVDAGEVVEKYKRLFTRIQDNRIMSEVVPLSRLLDELTVVDEVPDEIETEFLLAKNLLDKGIAAQRSWNEALSKVEEQYEEALENNNLYNALKSLESLNALPIKKFFADSGFDFDDNTRRSLQGLKDELTHFVHENIDSYIEGMYCRDIGHLTTFRNHNNRMRDLLDAEGFSNYAKRVEAQKNRELENVEEIKSRAELKGDCKKFLDESKPDRFMSYVAIKAFIKRGKELQNRLKKFGTSLGKDGSKIKEQIDERVQLLDAGRVRIEQDITDIWDDLLDIKTSEDVQDLIDRINLVLQKGISPQDASSLEEIKENLEELIVDTNNLQTTENSRAAYKKLSEDLRKKYQESEFDFDVMAVLEEIMQTVARKLDSKEEKWKERNLTLGNNSREAVHSWKERIRFLPEYLSEETKQKVHTMDMKADELIKIGKIDDVVFYFEKLSETEKRECLEKLRHLI